MAPTTGEFGAPRAYEFCRDVREAFDEVGLGSRVWVNSSRTPTTKSSAFLIMACSGLETRRSAKIDWTKSSAVRIIWLLLCELLMILPISTFRRRPGLAEFKQRVLIAGKEHLRCNGHHIQARIFALRRRRSAGAGGFAFYGLCFTEDGRAPASLQPLGPWRRVEGPRDYLASPIPPPGKQARSFDRVEWWVRW